MKEVLTVSELNSAIKKQLEARFSYICVRGEISNLREQSSGHIYFTLKDAEAQISAVLFKGSAKSLSKLPKEGDQVILRGELTVYSPRGNYQIIVREIELAGIGELLQRLHELKMKLQALGWFDSASKKPLPKIPSVIGVVTSPTGAVIQDILHILSRRFAGFHLILNPVRVQGEGAAIEIAKAIEEFNQFQLADVLIVGRGGGSLEDLWPFNEEIVAKAIRESKIPIISAVGHETDFCIADFVADLRAPTPSAAAELVIVEKSQQLTLIEKTRLRLKQIISGHIHTQKARLEGLKKHPLLSSPYNLLGSYLQRLDDIQEDLDRSMQQVITEKKLKLLSLKRQHQAQNPTTKLLFMRQQLQARQKQLAVQLEQILRQKKQKFEQLVAHLKAINPKNLLSKGYAILFQENGPSAILSTSEVKISDNLRVELQDGQLFVTVNGKKHE